MLWPCTVYGTIHAVSVKFICWGFLRPILSGSYAVRSGGIIRTVSVIMMFERPAILINRECTIMVNSTWTIYA